MRRVKNGLAVEFTNEWLDKLNEAFSSQTRMMCLKIINVYMQPQKPDHVLKLCDRLINWDKFDIEAAEIRFITLNELGKQSDANRFLKEFKISFKKKIGEYPKMTKYGEI